MLRYYINPKVYLIYKYANWCRSFNTKEELRAYLIEHKFTRRRLEEYLVIVGDGLWNEIWMELPKGTELGMIGEDQSAF